MPRRRRPFRRLSSSLYPRPRRLVCEPLEQRCLLAVGVGDLDPTFNTTGKHFIPFDEGGGNNDAAYGEAIQSDGKIVLVGYAAFGAGDNDFAVTRLNADGTLDSTFGTGGKAVIAFDVGPVGARDDQARGVTIEANGKIVVAGFAQVSAAGNYDFAVAQLTTAGVLDTTFGTGNSGKATVAYDLGGVDDDRANGVVIDPTFSRIILAGFADVGPGNHDFAMAGLTLNGALDTTFGPIGSMGKATYAFDLGGAGNQIDEANAITTNHLLGLIVVAGKAQVSATDYDMAVIETDLAGHAPTPAFKQTVAFDLGGNDVDVANAVSLSILPASDVITLAGSAEVGAGDTDFAIAQIVMGPNPALDTTFNGTGKQTVAFDLGAAGQQLDSAQGILRQVDGKLVAVGYAQAGAADYEMAAVRLLAGGGLDPTFGAGANGKVVVGPDRGGTNADVANAIAIQTDGDLVIAGSSDAGGASNLDFVAIRLVGDNAQSTAQSPFNVMIPGTAANDTFYLAFTSATNFTVMLDGVSHHYSTATVVGITYQDFGGTDTEIFQNAFGLSTVNYGPTLLINTGNLGIRGPDDHQFVYFYGYAGDQADFSFNATGSTAVVTDSFTSIGIAGVYSNQIAGLFHVAQIGGGGPGDQDGNVAFIYAKPGSQLFAGPITDMFYTNGIQDHLFLPQIYSQSTGDSSESAQLIGSNSDDTFVGTPSYTYIQGAPEGVPFFREAINYRKVVGTDQVGNDTAYFYDSPGNDVFIGTSDYSTLSGGSGGSAYSLTVIGFDNVYANSSAGADVAYLYDSPGNDTFFSHATYSYLVAGGVNNVVFGFATVIGESQAGNDKAFLFDGPGTNNFKGHDVTAELDRVSSGNRAFAANYEAVTVDGSLGNDDHKNVNGIDYALAFVGDWS